MRTFVTSDQHLGHKLLADVRGFSSISEMDKHIIEQHNAVVDPRDRVYFLGDVVMNRKNLHLIESLNGRKVLIKGNHDIFKLKDYLPYFDDIRAYRVFSEHGVILSHIPVHPRQLEGRFKFNVHGHTHSNVVLDPNGVPDCRYKNVCVEQIDYTPVLIDQIFRYAKDLKNE